MAGCGGSGESSTATDGAGKARIYPNVKGPTRGFLVANGDNSVQFFGREASDAERKEANQVIHDWMRARAAADWAADCSYFHRAYVNTLVKDASRVTDGKAKTCPQALEHFGSLASGNLVNTLTGPIDSLRVRAGKGYVQYHGRHGVDWIVPVRKENGHWKITTAMPINRNA